MYRVLPFSLLERPLHFFLTLIFRIYLSNAVLIDYARSCSRLVSAGCWVHDRGGYVGGGLKYRPFIRHVKGQCKYLIPRQ